jgi:DNA-binding MarR family transcriptional regulator
MDRLPAEHRRENIAETLEQVAALTVRHLADRKVLTFTAGTTLSRLDRGGPARLTALAAAEGISQPSMSQLVQRLERQGLATRVSDPEDGRAALIDITEAGRALLVDMRRANRAKLTELLATLPAEDEAALALAMHVVRPIVRRLIDNARRSGTPTGTITS